MKITYKFIEDIYNLLNSEDWPQPLRAKINEIETALAETPEQKAEERKALILEKSGTITDETYQSILQRYQNETQKLSEEKATLEDCIKQGKYKLGVAPFEDINNARILLVNSHILKLDSDQYNPDVINAMNGMFNENFKELYNEEVSGRYFHHISVPSIEDEDGQILEKLLNGEEVHFNDIVPEGTVLQEGVAEMVQIYLDNLQFLDKELLKYSAEKIQFIAKFYPNILTANIEALATTFPLYFDSKENIDNYLNKSVDFTSFATIENDVFIITDNIAPLRELSTDEIQSWQSLNSYHGKEAIKLFMQAMDLKKNPNFDLIKIIADNGIENALGIIGDYAKEIRFIREDNHNDLARLCHEYGIPETIFNKALDEILPNQKQSDDLPDITFNFQVGKTKYTFEKLKPGDVTALFLGKMTDCCQFIGGSAHQCVIDGFTRSDAGFYVIRDKKGKIYAQSYAWIGSDESSDVIMFDSFEYLPEGKKLFISVIKQFKEELSGTAFTALYVGSGSKTPLLKSGRFEVSPKNADLYKHMDSENAYKIESDVELATFSTNFIDCEDYNQFMASNPTVSAVKLYQTYSDSLQVLNSQAKERLYECSNIVYYLLENNLIKVDAACEFFNFPASKYWVFLNDKLMHIDQLKELSLDVESGNLETLAFVYSFLGRINIKLINSILAKYPSNVAEAERVLNTLEQIKPLYLNGLEPELLITLLAECEYVPYILDSTNDQECPLEIINSALKYSGNAERIEKVLNALGNIKPVYLNGIKPELLITLLAECEYVPYILDSTNDQECPLEIINSALKYSGNAERIEKVLNALGNIKPVYLNGIKSELLITLLAECEYVPYILNSANDQECPLEIINNFVATQDDIDTAAQMLGNSYFDGVLKFYNS